MPPLKWCFVCAFIVHLCNPVHSDTIEIRIFIFGERNLIVSVFFFERSWNDFSVTSLSSFDNFLVSMIPNSLGQVSYLACLIIRLNFFSRFWFKSSISLLCVTNSYFLLRQRWTRKGIKIGIKITRISSVQSGVIDTSTTSRDRYLYRYRCIISLTVFIILCRIVVILVLVNLFPIIVPSFRKFCVLSITILKRCRDAF